MAKSHHNQEEKAGWFSLERLAFLLGRLLIIYTMIFVPMFFYTGTWHHYAVPKNAAFQFFMLMVFGCWAFLALRNKMVRSPLTAPILFYLLFVIGNTLFAVNMAESWEMITFTLACGLIALFTPQFLNRFKDFEILLFFMGILCICVDIYGLAQHYNWTWIYEFFPGLGTSDGQRFSYQPVSFMGNRNYTAEVLNLTTPVCAMMVLFYLRYPAQLIFFSFVTLLNIITMYYIDCNASYFGAMAAFPIAFVIILYYKIIPWLVRTNLLKTDRVHAEYRARQGIVVVVLLLAILGTVIASTDNKVRRKVNTTISWVDVDGDNKPDGNPSIIFRLQCMDASMRKIADMPIFGIGPGNFKVVHPLYEKQLERKVLGEETLARKAHNDHLQQAVEYGIFGSFGWYWCIVTAFYAIFLTFNVVRRKELETGDNQDTPTLRISDQEVQFYFYLQLGLMAGMIVALIDSMFAHTFVITGGAMTFWLCMGLAAAAYQRLSYASRGQTVPWYSITNEALGRLQTLGRKIPGAIAIILIFALILPFGALNTYQMLGEGWLKRGMTYKDIGRYNYMFNNFDRAMQLYPYQMEIFYILGRYYIDALVTLDSAIITGDEEELKKLYMMGLYPKKRKELNDRGIVCLQTDLYMNPNYKWAHNNVGVIYDRYSYPYKYAEAFKPFIDIDPNDNMLQRVTLAAKNTYKRVLAIDEEQVYAHFNLGLGFMHKGNYERAIEELGMAILADPSKHESFRFMARCFIEKGDPLRGLAATDRYATMVLAKMKNSSKYGENSPRGKALRQVIAALDDRNLDRALEIAHNKLNWSDQDIYRYYFTIAHNLTVGSMKNPQAAMIAMQRAELSMPNPSSEFLRVAAQIYFNNNQPAKSAEKYRDLLRVEPNNVDMLRKLAQVYAAMDKVDMSMDIFERIMQLEPNQWQNNISYARILLANNASWEKAFPFVQKAVELGGDNARKEIARKDKSNYLYPMIEKDPRLRDLLGSKFID